MLILARRIKHKLSLLFFLEFALHFGMIDFYIPSSKDLNLLAKYKKTPPQLEGTHNQAGFAKPAASRKA